MKKYLFLVTFLLCNYGEVLSQTNDKLCQNYKEITLSGASYHFTERTSYSQQNGYNSLNFGAGINCSVNNFGKWNDEIQVGILRNSFREPSGVLSYGVLYPTFNKLSVGVKGVLASGYQDAPTNFYGFIVSPMLSAKLELSNDIYLNMSLVPSLAFSGYYIDGFIYGNLGFRF